MSRTIEVKFTDRPALSNSILLLTMMFFSATAFADKPEWAGRGDDGEKSYKHEKKHEKKYRKKEDREDDEHEDHHEDHHRHYDRHQSSGSSIEINIGGYFGETQRSETREYYSERISSGHCPPGLKKKRNGCVPPGHSKQWVIGEQLPREVKFSTIDPEIKIRLGMPPAGHQFVRVASDILLIAVGTGLVIDAIQDLGQIQQ